MRGRIVVSDTVNLNTRLDTVEMADGRKRWWTTIDGEAIPDDGKEEVES